VTRYRRFLCVLSLIAVVSLILEGCISSAKPSGSEPPKQGAALTAESAAEGRARAQTQATPMPTSAPTPTPVPSVGPR